MYSKWQIVHADGGKYYDNIAILIFYNIDYYICILVLGIYAYHELEQIHLSTNNLPIDFVKKVKVASNTLIVL